jgi:hypothetical protein
MLTVITPATSTRLTTVPTALAHLGLDGSPDEFYPGDLVDAASAAIASYCNRVFALETVREIFRNSGDTLVLTRTPVVGEMTVAIGGAAIAAGDMECDREAGLLYRVSGYDRVRWPSGAVSVTYQGGYSLPGRSGQTLPRDVEQACLVMVSALHSARGRDPLLRSETTEDVGASSWLDPRAGMEALPPQAAGLLAGYRRWSIA